MNLSGHFPTTEESGLVGSGHLNLLWCRECNLVQLDNSIDASLMYGDNYGYRSGLNPSMVSHLESKVKYLLNSFFEGCDKSKSVLDIGSNDGTLLSFYPSRFKRVGVDPTIKKFGSYYKTGIQKVEDFFSSSVINSLNVDVAKFDIITCIAMFYDLEDPISFAKDIKSCLKPNGIWHFEQSYLPCMLRTNSYDTVCHEHIEYYSLTTVTEILKRSGLKVIDVSINSVNGGSFAVTATHEDSDKKISPVVAWMIRQEISLDLSKPKIYRNFEYNAYKHAADLKDLILALRSDNKRIAGYGASTKGNVILQFAKLTKEELFAIADVNPLKHGCVTPGTNIPILSEGEVFKQSPDYLLVLPWHFRDYIIRKENKFLASGGKIIFPLPYIEIVG